MRKKAYLYLAFAIAGLVSIRCARSELEHARMREGRIGEFSVVEARRFFEAHCDGILTRSADGVLLPFVLGDFELKWDEADLSSSERVSSVDIPIRGGYTYQVIRRNESGAYYVVESHSKVVVVKSPTTDSLACYIRVCIPDEFYAGLYDGNIADMTLNCEDRIDYCGLEYYATQEGTPVAIVRYSEGVCVDAAYLYDEFLSEEERVQRFAEIMGDMWVVRNEDFRMSGEKERDEWLYGPPGAIFIDASLAIYVYVDTDNDGRSDAVTQFPWGRGGSSGDSNTGSESDPGNNMPGFPWYLFPDPGPGGSGGSGGSGGNGAGSPGAGDATGRVDEVGDYDDGSGTDSGDSGASPGLPPIKGEFPPLDLDPVDPTPFDPIRDNPINKGDEESEGEEAEKKPCFRLDSVKANPLVRMKILGTPVNGVKGGRYGMGRGRMHGGLDLAAEIGTPVYAMFDGVVEYAIEKFNPAVPYEQYKYLYERYGRSDYNAGNRVKIVSQTTRGVISQKYFHLNDVRVYKGQTVTMGMLIGHTGATGSACSNESAGPHLHLEVYENGVRVDPENYLYTRFDSAGNAVNNDCDK